MIFDHPFALGDSVRIKVSGETGTVTGVSIYATAGKAVFVHYQAADGRAVTAWWDAEDLEINAPVEARGGHMASMPEADQRQP